MGNFVFSISDESEMKSEKSNPNLEDDVVTNSEKSISQKSSKSTNKVAAKEGVKNKNSVIMINRVPGMEMILQSIYRIFLMNYCLH